MKKISFIQAVISDIWPIIEIEKVCWEKTYSNPKTNINQNDITARFEHPDFKKNRIKEIKNELNDGNKHFKIILVDGKIIGYYRLWLEKEKNDLVELYIHPDYQGKGVGTAAMESIFSLVNKKLPTVLEVAIYNQKAITFYKKFGFEITNDLKQDPQEDWNVLPSGNRIPVVFMIKK